MRFWTTKNSELPVREQLVRQVLLGILSEDLPPSHELPSVCAVARRQNYEPEEVLQRLARMIHLVTQECILLAEPDPNMREILHAELSEAINAPIGFADLDSPELGVIRTRVDGGASHASGSVASAPAAWSAMHRVAVGGNPAVVARHADRGRPRTSRSVERRAK